MKSSYTPKAPNYDLRAKRFNALKAHLERHPNDKQSATHLTHQKWGKLRDN